MQTTNSLPNYHDSSLTTIITKITEDIEAKSIAEKYIEELRRYSLIIYMDE